MGHGTGYSLPVLAAVMKKIVYPGLDLRGLKKVIETIKYKGVKV